MAKVEQINVFSTFATCFETRGEKIPVTKWEWTQAYVEGAYPPHYPVPAKCIYVAIEPNLVVTLENDGTGYAFNNPSHEDDGFLC